MLLTPVCAVFVCVHSVQDVSSAMTECYSHQPVLCCVCVASVTDVVCVCVASVQDVS